MTNLDRSERMRLIEMALATARALNLPRCWWWLSFADADRPEGQQLLGVAVVRGYLPKLLPVLEPETPEETADSQWLEEAMAAASAVREAHRLGANPGGQVAMLCDIDVEWIPVEYRERLITPGELAAARDRGEPWAQPAE